MRLPWGPGPAELQANSLRRLTGVLMSRHYAGEGHISRFPLLASYRPVDLAAVAPGWDDEVLNVEMAACRLGLTGELGRLEPKPRPASTKSPRARYSRRLTPQPLARRSLATVLDRGDQHTRPSCANPQGTVRRLYFDRYRRCWVSSGYCSTAGS